MTSNIERMAEAKKLSESTNRGFLFLCVANSARSQMAEGIARHLVSKLPADKAAAYRIESAGSEPTKVRPEAKMVLDEIGIDIEKQYSKNVSEMDPEGIDTVITLCAEEKCPVFPGDVLRLSWSLQDPAENQGDLDKRLAAFRAAREELMGLLEVVFKVNM